MRRVVFYANHQGSGHLQHAMNLARNPDIELLVMTSRRGAAALFADDVQFRSLENDFVDGFRQPAGSPFHHTPLGEKNVRRRAQQIHDILNEFAPDVVISDVSVEVATLVYLLGYPVIFRRMHGDRTDLPHRTAYALASGLIAWFPQSIEQPNLDPSVVAKTTYAGMLLSTKVVDPISNPSNTVVVLTSLGGAGVDVNGLRAAALATPDWQWRVVGKVDGAAGVPPNVTLLGVIGDPGIELARAKVVISSAGHNAVRDVASAMRPLILLPEPRPHDEQIYFAEALAKAGDADVVRDWSGDWNRRLELAAKQDPQRLADSLFVAEAEFHRACSRAIEQALAK